MKELLRCLTRACWKVGLTKRPADADELARLSLNMFAVAVRPCGCLFVCLSV